MPTVADYLDWSQHWVDQGYRETSNPENGQRFSPICGRGYQAWCADFVSAGLIEIGAPKGDVPNTGYTPDLAQWFHDRGLWHGGPCDYEYDEYDSSYRPQPGDVVLFQWNSNPPGRYGHTGIVVSSKHWGDIQANEGNTNHSGSNDGGGCERKHRTSQIAGYGRLPCLSTGPQPAPEETDMPYLVKSPKGDWWLADAGTLMHVASPDDLDDYTKAGFKTVGPVSSSQWGLYERYKVIA